MQNTYISSITSFRTNNKGSVCYSPNEYYFFNNHVNRASSSCTCCAFPSNGVSLNPRFVYGLRQSTLIHWPASRRLILGGGDRFFRLPISNCNQFCHGGRSSCCQCSCTRPARVDRDCCCCSGSYPVKESYECNSTSRRSKGKARRFKCMVWEEKGDSSDFDIDETMEAMLGLLTEDDKYRGQRRAISDYRKRGKYSESDCFEKSARGRLESVEKLREEDSRLLGRREGSLRDGNQKLRKDGSSCSSYEKENRLESVEKLRKEDSRLLGRREGSSRAGNQNLRKDGSSCSSYYSVLSSNEIDESDEDVQVKHEGFSGESFNRNKKDLRISKEDISVKNVIKQTEKNKDGAVGYREASTQENVANASSTEVVGSASRSRIEREKKVTDMSRIESDLSTVMDSHNSGVEMTCSSQNRFRGRGDIAVSSTYSVDETKDQRIQQNEARRKSQRLTEISQIQGSDIEHASSSQTRFRGREEKMDSSNLHEEQRERHSQTGLSVGQNESVRKSKQFSRMMDSRDASIISTSVGQRQFESTFKNSEDSSTSTFHEADDQSSLTDNRVVCETKSTKESQHLSNTSLFSDTDTTKVSDSRKVFDRRLNPQEEISASDVPRFSKNHDSNIIGTSSSQRLFESTFKKRDERSTSRLSAFHEVEDDNLRAHRVVLENQLNKDPQDLINVSATYPSDATIASDSYKLSERIMNPRDENLASHVDFLKEAREGEIRQASEHAMKQFGPKKESKSSAISASSSQPINFSQQASGHQTDNGRSSLVMLRPPPSQTADRTSHGSIRYRQPTTSEVSSETPGSGSSTIYTQEITPSFLDKSDNEIHEDQSNFHEDALGSVNRLEESSAQFVRQFVENLSHQSSSEYQEEKSTSEIATINKDLSQQGPDDAHSQVHNSRGSSSMSGERGPSDEIWDVAGPVAEEPSRTEAPGDVTSTSTGIAVKSGRSLWSIIGDIVRLRWSPRSETHNSSKRSGGKSSSNASVSSEAWFSGHDTDERKDENVKKGRRSTPKLQGSSVQPSLLKAGIQSLGGASEGMSSNNTPLQIEADASSSSDTLEGDSSSKGASPILKEEKIDRKPEESGQGVVYITSMPSSSSPLPSRHLLRSPAVKGGIPETGKAVVSGSDFVQAEQPVRESPTEASGTEVKDGELKRRKFQRIKQVEKETCEEWEEAYRFESEQRKIDEMFMKEALLEAKKAADTWEVPVGAVLVQHGKIIARGCNLVEDLRDSTAHAEMICIREASKLLRSWRLAETTLYVTLEPCAMCAGAILQARVDTVVWGAPNKLLGADGSWVRLFPGGSEVGGSSDQPAGPIHPFHRKITIRRGILATECADAMQQFFQLRRKKDKKLDSPPTPSLSISTHPSKFISKMHNIFSIMFCL